MSERVNVVAWDPAWSSRFEHHAMLVRARLGDLVEAVHHIGSTSIEGIHAKPIIDLLVEVSDIEAVDAQNDAMAAAGFEAMGEYGIPGRRYFRRHDAAGRREAHVHVFEQGSPDVDRHLAFRDFMRAHPEHAAAYTRLKRELATRHPGSMSDYADGKDAFVKEMEQRALAWAAARG